MMQQEFDFGDTSVEAMRKRRDQGIEAATAHADRVTGGDWRGSVVDMLRQYLKDRHEPFLTEQFVRWALQRGIEPPPDSRAWGSPMVTARKQNLIRRVGFTVDKFGSPKPLWIGWSE